MNLLIVKCCCLDHESILHLAIKIRGEPANESFEIVGYELNLSIVKCCCADHGSLIKLNLAIKFRGEPTNKPSKILVYELTLFQKREFNGRTFEK